MIRVSAEGDGMVRITAAGVVITVALALLPMGSAAAIESAHSIVGKYRVVTHGISGPGAGMTFRAKFWIRKFNRATGRFTGRGTETDPGLYSLTITGTVKGSKIVMRVRDAAVGYTATDRGRIEKNGNIKGTLADTGGNTGRWTMTRT